MIAHRVNSAHVPTAWIGTFGLGAGLLIGGCSFPEDGSSVARSASAAVSEASPSPTEAIYRPATSARPAERVPLPVMPELAKQQSSEGLQAFAEHWYALVTYGYETGDVLPLQAVSGPDCRLCTRIYEILDEGYQNDDWIVGGNFTVEATQSNYVLTNKNVYQVLIAVRQFSVQYRGPDNHLYGIDEGYSDTHMIEATYGDGKWLVQDAVIFKTVGPGTIIPSS